MMLFREYWIWGSVNQTSKEYKQVQHISQAMLARSDAADQRKQFDRFLDWINPLPLNAISKFEKLVEFYQ
jgi:hypothetical protein